MEQQTEMRIPMKNVRTFLPGLITGAILFAATAIVSAQDQSSAADRNQIKKSIEIVEGVLNTVRQQAIVTEARTTAKRNTRNGQSMLLLHASEGNRTEGIYVNGYGVIFEVYLPSFSEQRSFRLFMTDYGREAVSPRETVTVQSFTDPPQKTAGDSKTEPSTSTLAALSKLVESYSHEMQNKSKEMALRDLFAKLRQADLFPRVNVLETSWLEESASTDKSPAENPESTAAAQRKQFQDAIMKAIAEYGGTIAALRPTEFITVFLKAPVPRDFSLFSPETRTATIIRFSVRDLQEYKVGKISYDQLMARTKTEEN